MALADTLATLAPAIGTIAGGPVGGAVGTLVSGLIQGGQADGMRKKYEAYEKTIPMQDPMQVKLLDTIQGRRRALERGTDAFTSNRIGRAGDALAQTQANITRAGGGNVSDLLRSQRVTDQAVGNAGADAQRSAMGLLGMEGNLTGEMANRAYQRQMSRANVMWQEYARRREDSNRTSMAAIGMLPQIGFKGGTPGQTTPRVFDPLAGQSPGMGTYFPGAYDSQSAPNAPAVPMTPIPPSGGAPLPYQPFG